MKLNTLYEYKLLKNDIEEFAREAADKLAHYVFNNPVNLDMIKGTNKGFIIYKAQLRDKIVTVLLTNNDKNLAFISKSTIAITWDENSDIEDYEEVIEHELIHLFDPKLSDEFGDKEWNRYHTDHDDEYFKSFSEVDAFIPTLAKKEVGRLFRLYNHDSVKKIISNYSDYPERHVDAERIYKKDKNLWKKYLKALAHYFEIYKNKWASRNQVNKIPLV